MKQLLNLFYFLLLICIHIPSMPSGHCFAYAIIKLSLLSPTDNDMSDIFAPIFQSISNC